MADDDKQSRVALVTLGATSGAVGLSIISPGLKDAILAWLNKVLYLQLSLNAPLWLGIALLVLAALLLTLAFFGQSRWERGLSWLFNRKSARIGSFLALKHVGFAPVVRDLQQQELPAEFQRCDLRHLPVDLSSDLSCDPPLLEAALQKQMRMPDQIGTMLGINPSVGLGYCGIVQAPFQLLAGSQLASWTKLRCFEWHRHQNRWVALQEGTAPDLGVTSTLTGVGQGADQAIVIETSYGVTDADILASITSVDMITRISVAHPALDCITHEQQVDAITQQFRAALDAARALPTGAKVHVFVAAPMAVGFAAGRMISRTLHPPVRVYAYLRNAHCPYPWGLEINGIAGAAQVVRN